MTTGDDPTRAHAWLASDAMRTASDALLGFVLVIVGAAAIWDSRGASFKQWDRLDAGFFPILVGATAVGVGVLLLGRAALLRRHEPAAWKPWGIALVVAGVAAAETAPWWRPTWLLYFGPPEYTALIVLAFAAAIAAARWSRLRAVGMMLIGLLLSAVGTDVATGQPRLTMGFEQFVDGVSAILVVLGLVVVADGLICLVSPSLWLATFRWARVSQHEPTMPPMVSIALRAVAALAIAAACYVAFALNAQAWDIGLLLAIGLFGVGAKVLGWNRPVLIMACIYGSVLEENIRRSMLLSKGDPAVFFLRPISAALLVACLGLVALVIVLAARSSLLRRRAAYVAP